MVSAANCIKELLAPDFLISVSAIEIALDAYRQKGTTDEHLIEITEIMLRSINRPEHSLPSLRFYSWRGLTECRMGKKQAKSAIRSGKTGMYGNKNDDHIIRGYLKNYDTVKVEGKKASRKNIEDPLKHRGRVEIRLKLHEFYAANSADGDGA